MRRQHDVIRGLQERIAKLEEEKRKTDEELATARALLAATWPSGDIPSEPIPAELTHALRGPARTQAVSLVIDGVRVVVGVRGSARSDAAREMAVWSAVLRIARRKGRNE